MSSEIQNRSVQKDFSLDSLTLKHKSYYDENHQGILTATANATTQNLTNLDSGKVFQVVQAAGVMTVNLPVAQPGLKFTFVLTTAGAANVIIADPNATIYGVLINDVSSVVSINSGTSVRYSGGSAAIGDTIIFEAISKGVYRAKAITSTGGGITWAA